MPESIDLLVRAGLLVTMDDGWTEHKGAAVAVRDGAIVWIGPAEETDGRFVWESEVDASNQLVMPGFINAHTHAPMTVFRGLADDLPLDTWLKEYIWPAEANHVNPEMAYWGTQLAAAEMLRSGTVAFADMYFFEDQIGEAARDAGIRVVLGEALVDFPSPNTKTSAEGLAYVRASFERWADDPLVMVGLQPHSAYACSPDLLLAAKELAAEYDAIYLIHLCETAAEVEDVISQHGRRPVAHLESLGVLDERSVLAHGVHVTPDEIVLLAERGVSVSHCPESNMKLASGVAPIPGMLAAGVNVGLGTDGAASNNDLSLWGEMRAAAMLHKVHSGDPTVVSARDTLWMATRGGARALGLDAKVGSIEVGKRADLVCVGIDLPHTVPLYDPYSHLVYAAQSSDVQTVIVDGRPVYSQGEWLHLDLAEIYSRIRAMASQLEGRWTRDPNWRDEIGQ